MYYKNLKFNHLIEDIVIDFWSSWNFVSMEDIIKTSNPIVRVSQFTSNKKIYENFEGFLFKLVWRETFSISHGLTYGSFFFVFWVQVKICLFIVIGQCHYWLKKKKKNPIMPVQWISKLCIWTFEEHWMIFINKNLKSKLYTLSLTEMQLYRFD